MWVLLESNLIQADIKANGSLWVLGQHIGHLEGQGGATCHIGVRPQAAGSLEEQPGLVVEAPCRAWSQGEIMVAMQVPGAQDGCIFCLLEAGNSHIHSGQTLRVYVGLEHVHVFDAQGQRGIGTRQFPP